MHDHRVNMHKLLHVQWQQLRIVNYCLLVWTSKNHNIYNFLDHWKLLNTAVYKQHQLLTLKGKSGDASFPFGLLKAFWVGPNLVLSAGDEAMKLEKWQPLIKNSNLMNLNHSKLNLNSVTIIFRIKSCWIFMECVHSY